jgi:hypothetical protein
MRAPFALIAITAISLVTTLASSTAQAALSLRITQGAASILVTDGDTLDICPDAGCVAFYGSVGSFDINVGSALAGASHGLPYLSNLNGLHTGSGLIEIEAILDGVSGPLPALTLSVGGTLAPAPGVSLRHETLIDGVEVGALAFAGAGPFGFDGTTNGASGAASIVLQRFILDHGGERRTSSFTGTLTVTPLPAGLVLGASGLGLLGMGWLRRRPT